MPVEKGDFVEIAYTGRLKENDQVFDTTDEQVAKEADIHNENATYGPVIICVGEKMIVPGVDDALVGREAGNFTLDLLPENAFGRKDASLIQMISSKKFTEQKIQPFPGLQVNVDNRIGVVKVVTGGRILVDFNHPLAGKPVSYEISLKRTVNDMKEKVEAILKVFNFKDYEVTVENKKATITLEKELPEQMAKPLIDAIKRMAKLDEVIFTGKKSQIASS